MRRAAIERRFQAFIAATASVRSASAFSIAPASLQPALRAAKWLSDGHAPVPTQAAFAAPGVDVARVVERASARGIAVRTLSYFGDGPADPDGLVVGYGAIPTARVEEGLRRLGDCFRAGA